MNTPQNFTEKFKAYPIRIRIISKRGGSSRIEYERGRKVVFKDGTIRLRLNKRKQDIEYPENRFVRTDSKGKDIIDYFSPVEGEFYPMEITTKTIPEVDAQGNVIAGFDMTEMRPVGKDVQFWGINEYQRIQKKYSEDKDKWDKILPFITLGILGAIILVSVLTVTDSLVQVANRAASIANTLQSFDETQIRGFIADEIQQYVRDNSQVINPSNPNRPPF